MMLDAGGDGSHQRRQLTAAADGERFQSQAVCVGCHPSCANVPSTTPTSTEDRRYLSVQTG